MLTKIVVRILTNTLFTIGFAFKSLFRKGNWIFTISGTALVIGSAFVNPSATKNYINFLVPALIFLTGLRNMINAIGNWHCDKEKKYFLHSIQYGLLAPIFFICLSFVLNLVTPKSLNHYMSYSVIAFAIFTGIALIIYIVHDTYTYYCYLNDSATSASSDSKQDGSYVNVGSKRVEFDNGNSYGIYDDISQNGQNPYQSQNSYDNTYQGSQYDQGGYGYQQTQYNQNAYGYQNNQYTQNGYGYQNNQYTQNNQNNSYQQENTYAGQNSYSQYGYNQNEYEYQNQNSYTGGASDSYDYNSQGGGDQSDSDQKVANARAVIYERFGSCKTIEEARKMRNSLINMYHSDNSNGDDEISKIINVEYDKLKEKFGKG